MFECNRCGRKVTWIERTTQLCMQCFNDIQEKDEIEITLPGNLIAFWYDTISYIDKKKNRAYFKVLPEFHTAIQDNTEYLIIIKKPKR